MRLSSVRIRGAPGLRGRALEPGSGLVALIEPDRGARTLLVQALSRAMAGQGGGPLDLPMGTGWAAGTGQDAPAEAWVRVWGGAGLQSPGDLLAVAEELLVAVAGGGPLDDVAAEVPAPDGGSSQSGAGEVRARAIALEGAPEELRALERELRDLRADHVEAAGDLEAASVEWLRERQDAETQLLAYRDRARELKARLAQLEAAGPEARCLTCGRPLATSHPEVVAKLREEWETVVQDGSWWKKRRGQLEEKPAHVKGLEERTLRLQGATEGCAEKAERARARVEELAELRERLASGEASDRSIPEGGVSRPRPGRAPRGRPGPHGGEERDPVLAAALEAVRAEIGAEMQGLILERAAGYLVRVSGGRLLGISRQQDGSLRLEGVRGAQEPPLEEDLAAAYLCLRVAAAVLVHESGGEMESLLVGEPLDFLDGETGLRAVELLRDVARRLGQVLLLTRGELVDAVPEAFDGVLELAREEGRESWSLRRLPSGVGRIHLRS